MKVSTYILQLKEATGLSWNQISTGCGVPVSTIRSIASGSVAQPSHQTIHDIITFMGGSLDDLYATPASVRSEMLEVRKIEANASDDLKVTIREMREIREDMLKSQLDSFEKQMAKTEDAHAREISHMEEAHKRELAALQRSNHHLRVMLIIALAIALAIMLFVICILSYDLTHLDNGWIQAFNGYLKVASFTQGGI